MSMSMTKNNPSVRCMLEVWYARHLGFVILPNAAKSLPDIRDSSSSSSTDKSAVTRSSVTMDNTLCIQQLSLITHGSCDMTVRHR